MEEASERTRLTREYGLRHPFVSAGMGFVAHDWLHLYDLPSGDGHHQLERVVLGGVELIAVDP
jgi:hypothetical protein